METLKYKSNKRICNVEIYKGKYKGKICYEVYDVCHNAKHRDLMNKVKNEKEKENEYIGDDEKEEIEEVAIIPQEIKCNEEKICAEEITFDKLFNEGIINVNLDTGATCGIFGSSKSGKTTLLTKIFKKYKAAKEPFINFLFSENIHIPLYKDMRKDKMTVTSHFFLPRLVKMQYRINRQTNNKYKFLNIIDDIVDEKNDQVLQKAMLVYRNSLITTFISLQDCLLLRKTQRSNINGCFFLKINQDENVIEIIERFLGSYLRGNLQQKIQTYKEYTNNHKSILYLDALNAKLYIVT